MLTAIPWLRKEDKPMVSTTSNKGRKWLIIIVVVLAAVLLFLSLLPMIASSQWGKGRVLGAATPHIPGELSVDTWSLSWFGDQKITGISYSDPDTGVQVGTTEVTVAKGLFSFLLDRGNVGTVTVTRPDIQIRLPESATEDTKSKPLPNQDNNGTDNVEPSQSGVEKGRAAEPLRLPPISGRMVIVDGVIAVVRPDKGAEPVAKDINGEINIVSLEDPVTYSLILASPSGEGNFSGDGKVMLQGADDFPGSIQTSGDLLIKNWDISQLLDLAAAFGSAPAGKGILDSEISFDGSLNERVTVNGTIDLANLELFGGPLGDDKPFIEKTSIVLSLSTDLDSLELSSLELSSPLADGSLSALVAADGAQQFTTDLRINLQKVAEQLPHTLNLQEGLQITDGTIELEGQAHLDQGENRFQANALVDGLSGVRDSKKISLAEPFSLSLKGQQGKGGLNLENFSVTSSFLQGEGQGNLNDMQLSLNADLGAALAEISQFIALQDYQAKGQLVLSVKSQRKDEKTVGLVALVDADKLIVKQADTVIIPEKPLKIEVNADLLLSSEFVFGGASVAKLGYQSWLGSGALTGQDIVIDPEQKLNKIGQLAGNGQLKLNELASMLKSLGLLPETFAPRGDSRFQIKLSGAGGRFQIEELLLDSPKFSMQKGGSRLVPESGLKIRSTSELIMGDDGSLSAVNNPTLAYESWLGNGTIQAAALDVPTSKVDELVFAGRTNLNMLTALLSDLELLPPDLSFSGWETSSLKMDYSPEQIDLASLHTEIEDFVLTQEGKTYRDKKLVIETSGSVDMVNRKAALRPVHIDSANGRVSFEQLVVGDWNNLLDTLDSAGQARFDLSTILGAASDWVTLPPDISTAATVDLNWTAAAQSGAEHRYSFSADLDKFSLGRGDLQALADEQVSVKLDGTRNPTSGKVALNQLSISSTPLNFDAAGSWTTSTEDDTELAFKGDLGMDLARIATLIRTFTELDLEMAGNSQRPFELGLKVNQEQRQKWWQHTDFSGAFQADLIRVLGVELRGLEIPVLLSDGYGKAEVEGSVNQGTLLLQPHLDLVSYPPVLTIPDDSLVLDRMQITQEMANQLLARIHPLFMGAGQLSGFVDLTLDRFRWPLGKENLNDLQFSGKMDFEDVRLDSSALLGSLLSALRVQDRGLDLSGRQIQFVCKDGRIETNPLRTNLGDSELVISGSLGLDTTIDYLAQVEVTRQLVGGDLYKYLEGTVIHVPVGGTLEKPDISANTVQRAVTDLINQAGQKKLQEAAGNLLKKLF